MSVRIGNRTFDGPFPDLSTIVDDPGVYAIVCPDAGGYFLVDIGESDTLKTRLKDHEREECWARVCSARSQVAQYAVLYTRQVPQHYRQAIEQELRKLLTPPCGNE